MAGAGYKLFQTGDVLTAAQVNTYLNEQTVMVFANSAARTSALTSVLAEGMVSYLQDTNAVEVYDGSNWVSIGASGDITGVTAGTGISGGGTSGTVTITNDMATTITAAGDIVVGTGSGTYDNLPIGTTGQVLTADTTVSPYKVKWATAGGSSGPAFKAKRTAGEQSLTSGAYTKLQLNSEVFDTDSCYDPSTNYRFTPNKAGYYMVVGRGNIYMDSFSTILMKIYKNGSSDTDIYGWNIEDQPGISGTTLIYMNGSTDYLELYGYGGGNNPKYNNDGSEFSAIWIRS